MPTGNSQQKSSPSAPEKASSTKQQAGSELLTKPPWDPGWLTSAGRVAARDQLPRGEHSTPEMVLPLCTRELSIRDPGGDKTPRPTWGESAAKHQATRAARTWEGHKTQAQPSLRLGGVPKNLNLSGLDPGSARNPGPALDSCPTEQPGA